MTTQRNNWLQQERDEKAYILKRLWEDRVKAGNSESLQSLKDFFLRTQYPPGHTIESWTEKLNQAWKDGSAFSSPEQFNQFFSHIPSLKVVGYVENLLPERALTSEPARITSTDEKAFADYIKGRELNVACIMGSVNHELTPCCSEGYSEKDVFTTQSLTKIFTGVLALRLIEENIISETDFTTPGLQLSEATLAALKEEGKTEILARLPMVTLHDALTHHAGLGVGEGVALGDYYPAYLRAVETAQAHGKPPPDIKSVDSFVQFIPNQVSQYGDNSRIYSNSGIALAGLSLLHLYNEHRLANPHKNLPPLDFDGLMKRYVTGPANMQCFAASPAQLNPRMNPADKLSMQMVGTPGGGYYSTARDLANFASWMANDKCKDPRFLNLIEKYGREFCPHPTSKTIEHTGDGPYSSGFFSLNWGTGNVVVVLNDQRGNVASEVGRLVKENVLLRMEPLQAANVNECVASTSTGRIFSSIPPSKNSASHPTPSRGEKDTSSAIANTDSATVHASPTPASSNESTEQLASRHSPFSTKLLPPGTIKK